MPKITISVFRAEVGGFLGLSRTHPKLIEKAQKLLKEEKGRLLIDSFVTHCGDDLELIMTHSHGTDNKRIHRFAGDVFAACARIASEIKLYGAGRDSQTPGSADRGPCVAELEFEERESDPVLIFIADKTGPGAWNFILYKIFADPFNTAGLVSDPSLHQGFDFEVHDMAAKSRIIFRCPEESYRLLAHISDPSRSVIRRVFRKDGEITAVTSSRCFDINAGANDNGDDDPVMIVRAQDGFPLVGEALEPFCTPVLVGGGMRGFPYGPLMPVGLSDVSSTRSDGPARALCFGFQVTGGELIGPADMFDDPAFDRARARCNELADAIRVQGPFAPRRLPREVKGHAPRHTVKEGPAPGREKLPE